MNAYTYMQVLVTALICAALYPQLGYLHAPRSKKGKPASSAQIRLQLREVTKPHLERIRQPWPACDRVQAATEGGSPIWRGPTSPGRGIEPCTLHPTPYTL